MHDGCTKTSIARSHTIPLSGSLRLIAEDVVRLGHSTLYDLQPRFGGAFLTRI
jgi:hypothetical protein